MTPCPQCLLQSVVHYGDVKLTWEPPSDTANFLDLTLKIQGDRIFHEPFVKAMSHRERIPWTSAHPKDVKKGTFSSEISRLATLCSDYDVYALQCEEAVNLYIGRGYPKNLVTSWLKDQKEKRWANRLSIKVEEDPAHTFFILKTHFNDAWKGFNVQEMGTRIIAQWDTGIDRSVVAGRKRLQRDNPADEPSGSSGVKRRRVNIGLQGSEFPGQSRLRFTQDDGTDVAGPSVQPGVPSGHLIETRRQLESRWTQRWVTTGKFFVSRRKNTQLWDVTRGWNNSVWNRYLEEEGKLRPFAPLYEGYVPSDDEAE